MERRIEEKEMTWNLQRNIPGEILGWNSPHPGALRRLTARRLLELWNGTTLLAALSEQVTVVVGWA